VDEIEVLRSENAKLRQMIKLLMSEDEKEPIPKVKFVDYYQSWLENRKNHIGNNTYHEYNKIFEKHIFPYFSEREYNLQEISHIEIQEYYRYKLSKGMTPNSLLKHHANLYTAFQDAFKNHIINVNPMTMVERPKKSKFIAQYYSLEQILSLFKATRNSELFTVILLASFLGLRRSEIVALQWDAINFHERTIAIKRKAILNKETGLLEIVKNMKTESSNRILVLPDCLDSASKAVTFHNAMQFGKVIVTKVTEDGRNKEGIKFTLSGTSDNGTVINMTAATDKSGVVTFSNIPVGSYSLFEDSSTVAAGYKIAASQTISVTHEGESKTTFTNNNEKGKVKVVKTSDDGKNIKDVEFKLSGTSTTGVKIDVTVKTDAKGEADFGDLYVGTYTIEEVASSVNPNYSQVTAAAGGTEYCTFA
jgi:site-specific recombinase XerC